MSKKLDAAIDALVDALAELPEHELEGWQRGNRLGLRILCELARRYPGIMQPTGPVRPLPLPLLGKVERPLLAVDHASKPVHCSAFQLRASGVLPSPSHCLGEY